MRFNSSISKRKEAFVKESNGLRKMDSGDKPRPNQRFETEKTETAVSKESLNEKNDVKQEKTKQKEKKKKIIDWGWSLKILLLTFSISFAMSYLSKSVLSDVNLWIALIVLFLFIFIGVIFDLIGTAIMSVEAKSFNSMAAKKVVGAKAALSLISKASSVSNFCNDVIGDICGVISGTMCSVVAIEISEALNWNVFFITLVTTAFTASLTVGSKAVGKNLAIAFSDKIIYAVARVLCLFIPERVFDNKKKK
jgi:hypothetical protein